MCHIGSTADSSFRVQIQRRTASGRECLSCAIFTGERTPVFMRDHRERGARWASGLDCLMCAIFAQIKCLLDVPAQSILLFLSFRARMQGAGGKLSIWRPNDLSFMAVGERACVVSSARVFNLNVIWQRKLQNNRFIRVILKHWGSNFWLQIAFMLKTRPDEIQICGNRSQRSRVHELRSASVGLRGRKGT